MHVLVYRRSFMQNTRYVHVPKIKLALLFFHLSNLKCFPFFLYCRISKISTRCVTPSVPSLSSVLTSRVRLPRLHQTSKTGCQSLGPAHFQTSHIVVSDINSWENIEIKLWASRLNKSLVGKKTVKNASRGPRGSSLSRVLLFPYQWGNWPPLFLVPLRDN